MKPERIFEWFVTAALVAVPLLLICAGCATPFLGSLDQRTIAELEALGWRQHPRMPGHLMHPWDVERLEKATDALAPDDVFGTPVRGLAQRTHPWLYAGAFALDSLLVGGATAVTTWGAYELINEAADDGDDGPTIQAGRDVRVDSPGDSSRDDVTTTEQ